MLVTPAEDTKAFEKVVGDVFPHWNKYDGAFVYALNLDQSLLLSFPVAVADGALLRDDLSALQHLKLWLLFQRHYCEHKPSVTISVKEHEWMDVGAWVYKHFDEVTGVSFLPMDGGTYKQAPYEECTEEQYNQLRMLVPEAVDWDNFKEYDDNVEGAQMLSCTAGGCSI